MDDLINRQAVFDLLQNETEEVYITSKGRTKISIAEIDVEDLKALPSFNPQANDEDIHREREQAYMKGYEDASKRYRTDPCDDAISRSDAIRVASGYCHWTNIPKELAKLPSVNPKPCEMTAEEYRQRMIQAFHNADCDELISVCALPTEKEFEHLEWLLKNHYKKEPCEDAISRQAAIDAMCSLCGDGTLKENEWRDNPHIDGIIDALNELPSVSTEKTGRWKRRIVDSGYNADWSCSCCGYKVKTDFVNFKYCPECGSRNGEVGESK